MKFTQVSKKTPNSDQYPRNTWLRFCRSLIGKYNNQVAWQEGAPTGDICFVFKTCTKAISSLLGALVQIWRLAPMYNNFVCEGRLLAGEGLKQPQEKDTEQGGGDKQSFRDCERPLGVALGKVYQDYNVLEEEDSADPRCGRVTCRTGLKDLVPWHCQWLG